MRGASRYCGAVYVLLTLTALAGEAWGQGDGYPRLTAEDEIRLAVSAGPLAVSQQADVYVMGSEGFARALTGGNGWACLVVRSANNRIQLAPHCLNPQAVATVLPALLLEGRLQAQGWEAGAISAELLRRFKSGELPMPSGPAYAYMLSSGQQLGPNGSRFKPHFMLYVPFATNASIGGDVNRQKFPFVGPYENHPLSTIVIIMDEFVDPAAVRLPPR